MIISILCSMFVQEMAMNTRGRSQSRGRGYRGGSRESYGGGYGSYGRSNSYGGSGGRWLVDMVGLE